MRLKNFSALVLSGAMIAGTIGAMNPVSVLADEENTGVVTKNTYTMTVPADTSITKAGWNDLGKITITKAGEFDSEKNITVTAESGHDFKLVSGENNIAYTLKTAEGGEAQTSFEFKGENINDGNASQAIGVDVTIPDNAVAGEYTDTITYTAAMSGGNSGSDSDGDSENQGVTNLFTNHLPVEFGLKDGNKIVVKYKSAMSDYDVDKSETTVSDLSWFGGINNDVFSYGFGFDGSGDSFNVKISNKGEVSGDTDRFSYIKIGGEDFWKNESDDSTSGDINLINKEINLKYVANSEEGYTKFLTFKPDSSGGVYGVNEIQSEKCFEYAGVGCNFDENSKILTITFLNSDDDKSIALAFNFNKMTYTIQNDMDILFEFKELTIDGTTYEFNPA